MLNIPQVNIPALATLANSVFMNKGGAVMGKLGNFVFFMHQNAYNQIGENLTAEFSSFKPIKGQKILGDSGGFEHRITLDGVLIAQPLYGLDPLKLMLMAREPIDFTTVTFSYDVVIKSITLNKQKFGLIGDHRVQSYNITLERIYGAIL